MMARVVPRDVFMATTNLLMDGPYGEVDAGPSAALVPMICNHFGSIARSSSAPREGNRHASRPD